MNTAIESNKCIALTEGRMYSTAYEMLDKTVSIIENADDLSTDKKCIEIYKAYACCMLTIAFLEMGYALIKKNMK